MQTSKLKTTRALDDSPATAGGAPATPARHAIKTTRAIAIESVVGVAATLGIAALCGVPYLGLGSIDPHPVWLVVLVIAARYGTHGLSVVLPIAWGALALATAGDGPGRVLDTLAMPVDLGRWRGPCWSPGSRRATNGANGRWPARSRSWSGAPPLTAARSATCGAPRSRCGRATIASICR